MNLKQKEKRFISKTGGFEIAVICSPDDRPGEQAQLLALLEAGVQRLHLRKKHWSMWQTAAFLDSLPAAYHSRIILHAHPGLLKHYALAGFHGKQAQATNAPLRGCSVHSYEEYGALYAHYDYLWLSPFFDSLSKQGYAASEALWQPPAHCPLDKVVALGGIAPQHLPRLARLGIRRAAVLGYIWNAKDPVKAWKTLQTIQM
ncbi:MAG: thiamine phosphate synthase [Thermonema sp.]|uniref:thiamine phosphate synthase n=1 Tax=Thermonema sp. TaxID=2231181 RepID=UPI0021DC4679|nr:thiamine phosphate synthase [Thermonema sp.]GIV40482.1 MAG: thiamine phosphate synthase [Thermonema sp.]